MWTAFSVAFIVFVWIAFSVALIVFMWTAFLVAFIVFVWTGKTIVRTQYVFSEMKTQTFENVFVWTGLPRLPTVCWMHIITPLMQQSFTTYVSINTAVFIVWISFAWIAFLLTNSMVNCFNKIALFQDSFYGYPFTAKGEFDKTNWQFS